MIASEKIQAIRNNFPSEKLDDATISRFLIARNNDIQKTTDMINNYLVFKKAYNIDNIRYPNGIDVPFTISVRKFATDANYDVNAVGVKEEFKRFYPATGGMGVHGVDKHGHPILIELMGKYNVKKMAELCEAEDLKQLCILNNEFIFGPLVQECSRMHGRRIEKVP